MKEYAEIQSSPNYQYTAAPLEVIYIYIYILFCYFLKNIYDIIFF